MATTLGMKLALPARNAAPAPARRAVAVKAVASRPCGAARAPAPQVLNLRSRALGPIPSKSLPALRYPHQSSNMGPDPVSFASHGEPRRWGSGPQSCTSCRPVEPRKRARSAIGIKPSLRDDGVEVPPAHGAVPAAPRRVPSGSVTQAVCRAAIASRAVSRPPMRRRRPSATPLRPSNRPHSATSPARAN